MLLFAAPLKTQAAAKYTIYVNRQTNLINVVNTKTKKVVKAMYCSTGRYNRTIKGTFKTKAKYRWRPLMGGVYGQYSTRIQGHYLFHSVPYYSRSVTNLEKAEYNKLGTQASAGCIRLTTGDAKWIYDHCSVGTTVVINDTCKLKKPKYKTVKVSLKNKIGWDPTDPDVRNPYYPKLTQKTKASAKIEQGSKFDPLKYINVKSDFSTKKELLENVTVKGTVNTKKTGSYKLTYTLKEPRTGLKTKKTFTFKVVKKAAETTE